MLVQWLRDRSERTLQLCITCQLNSTANMLNSPTNTHFPALLLYLMSLVLSARCDSESPAGRLSGADLGQMSSVIPLVSLVSSLRRQSPHFASLTTTSLGRLQTSVIAATMARTECVLQVFYHFTCFFVAL